MPEQQTTPVQQQQRGYTAEQLERLWATGRPAYYTMGDPVPDGAQVTPHEGGLLTLERTAPLGFDKDLREKALRLVDQAFERAHADPSEDLPNGKRPYALVVNPGFTHYFPGVDSWGELNPPCRVREVDGKDARFNKPGAVKIGPEGRQIKAYFVTEEPKPGQGGGDW